MCLKTVLSVVLIQVFANQVEGSYYHYNQKSHAQGMGLSPILPIQTWNEDGWELIKSCDGLMEF